jgi:hypothetical protein
VSPHRVAELEPGGSKRAARRQHQLSLAQHLRKE